MKHILRYGLGCMWASLFTASFVACEDDVTGGDLVSINYPASVEMVLPESAAPLVYQEGTVQVLPLVKGESLTLGCVVKPDDATSKDVVWSTSNASAVTVDAEGHIQAVSGADDGYAIVTVAPEASYSGAELGSSLKVTVAEQLVKAERIELTSAADQVYAGETLQLSLAIFPEDATYKTVKWTCSDESVATVDSKGLVTGLVNEQIHAQVTITATSLDGGNVVGTKDIMVNQIVQPQEISISQDCSAGNGYLFAIADKKVTLDYATVPEDCTKSLIRWTSSNEALATVEGGVVTFNQAGVFGDVTITAVCPETGDKDEITLHIEEGLVRELFHDPDNYGWYNAKQSGNGTSSSHEWSYGKVTVTTYTQNATKQRGDFRCWNAKTWLHAGYYPIFAIRMQDVKDLYDGVTARNITLDASGSCAGTNFSGGLDGNNNKWLHDYKCSDGSHVFIYDLSKQKWANGGVLPTTAVAEFSTLQFKYADIATLTTQVTYDVYWVQSFKTIEDLQRYVTEVEGLTYEVVK